MRFAAFPGDGLGHFWWFANSIVDRTLHETSSGLLSSVACYRFTSRFNIRASLRVSGLLPPCLLRLDCLLWRRRLGRRLLVGFGSRRNAAGKSIPEKFVESLARLVFLFAA